MVESCFSDSQRENLNSPHHDGSNTEVLRCYDIQDATCNDVPKAEIDE